MPRIQLPQLTPKLDMVIPYDPQSDVEVIGQQYQRMGLEVARAMTPKALPTSELDPIPLPFMGSNIITVAKMVGGFSYLEYTVSSSLGTKSRTRSQGVP